MSKVSFINSGFYHIYNRGVEGRSIFQDEADYFRFLLSMREFNNMLPIFNLRRYEYIKKAKDYFNQKPLVELVCYSLMPNHYHFIVRQLEEGGISKYMHKLGTGYTMYFNKRHTRTGVLFQGPFKSKHISSDDYIIYLSLYIHLNAFKVIWPDLLKRGIRDKKAVYESLKNYKWHSFPFWLEDKPSLLRLHPATVLDQFSSKGDYEKLLEDCIEFTVRGEASNKG